MFLQRVYGGRLGLGLFLLIAFGVAEYAESGLFRRCRLRRRCCRPVVCQPVVCPPMTETLRSQRAMQGDCDGKMCLKDIIGCVYEFPSGKCVHCDYRATLCSTGTLITYTGECHLTIGTNCKDCIGCMPAHADDPIPIPDPPPTGDPIPAYVAESILQHGLPANVQLKPGKSFNVETWQDGDRTRQGVVIQMQLRDANGELIPDKYKKVHLDWFSLKDKKSKPESYGRGHETAEELYGTEHAKISNSIRVTDYVYSLSVSFKGEQRLYVVYLTGNSSGKK